MARASKVIEIEGNTLREYMEDKDFSIQKLANETGISHSSISRYINNQVTPKEAEARLICFTLGIELEDIMKKSPVVATETASSLIENNEVKNELSALSKKVDGLASDLSKVAKLLIEIQKVASESKAQTELNRESIEVISNKVTQTNSICSQINAKIRKSF